MNFRRVFLVVTCMALAAGAHAATNILIATVNNDHMIEMQNLTRHFEAANPQIKVKWKTMEEGKLRSEVTADIASKAGQFDVITIGAYETPIWGKKGWLKELKPDAAYDVNDLLPAIRKSLMIDDRLYAMPFYGESSMLMYRQDLMDKAGINFSERPTWDEVRSAAAKIHRPQAGMGRKYDRHHDHGQQFRRAVV